MTCAWRSPASPDAAIPPAILQPPALPLIQLSAQSTLRELWSRVIEFEVRAQPVIRYFAPSIAVDHR